MPTLNLELPTQINADDAFKKIETFINGDNHFKKFDPKLTSSFDAASKTCHLNGSQFKAQICVMPQKDTTKVVVTVDIPLALALFKGKIKEEIEKAFKKILA